MNTIYNIWRITQCATETARVTGQDERAVKRAIVSIQGTGYQPTLDEQIDARRMVMEAVDAPIDAETYRAQHGEEQLSTHTSWMPVHMLAQKMGVASQTLRHSPDEYGVEFRTAYGRNTYGGCGGLDKWAAHHKPYEEARAPWSAIKKQGQISRRWEGGRAARVDGKTPWMQVSRMMGVLDLTERQIRKLARRENEYGLVVTQNGGGNWFCCDEEWRK